MDQLYQGAMMAILLNSNKVPFRLYFLYYVIDTNGCSPSQIDKKHPCWMECNNIILSNISPTKSIGKAIHDYFNYYNYGIWNNKQYFLKICCDNCDGITIYAEPNCIPFAGGDCGQLVCPHCGHPWLTYKYGE